MPRLRSLYAPVRLLPAAALLALTTACPPPADTTPPAGAALTAGTITDTSIQLRWTAVGDDDTTGTAASYELRSLSGAACPITQANFATGTPASGLGAPQAPGTAESATVSGLTGDTGYCFMLKVTDEAGNASFSAAATASTTDLVAPDQAVLAATTVGDTSVTLTWAAVGDNGATGTAASHELRYASPAGCPLTASNFAAATAVSGLPAPAPAGTAQSATVSGLVSAAGYCFALRVADEAGNSSLSTSLGVLTLDSVAPAQVTLSAGAATGSSLTLGWTAVGDDGSSGTAASYELRYLTGAACPITQASFSTGSAVANLSAPAASGTAESFTVTGLTSDTAHCFMLKVTDDAGNASFSNAASGSTLDVTAPDAAALFVSSASGTTIQLGWLAVGDDGSSGAATGYELRYASGAACPLTPATFSGGTLVTGLSPPSAPGTPESATASGLASETAYCFMLQVSDESGNASFSNVVSQTTQDVLPPASAQLGAGVIAATSIQVLWTAVGDDGTTGTASAHDLRYRAGAACPITAANFSASTQVTGLAPPRSGGQPESFIVQGLGSDTSHCFMLQVNDEAGNTSLSNALTASTPDVTPPAAAQLSAGAATASSVQVNWTAVGDDGSNGTAAAYELRYRVGAACPITATNFASSTQVSGLGTPGASGSPESFTVGGLASGTDHCFMLQVSDEAGNSSLSNALDAATQDVTAPAAALLSAGAITASSIQVNWTAVGDDGTTGTAAAHDLRYRAGAACPITAANFASSTQVAGLGAPGASGSSESFTVGGLTSDTAYCFMLQVGDEAGNTSLSNALDASTPDVTAPAAAQLSAGAITASSIQVNWTAVGDDGATGTAAAYDLRYRAGAACPITAANFASSTQVSGLGTPGAAGSPESFTVGSLASDTAYCFMLQVGDEAGNTSLSNALDASTPDVTPPASVTLTGAAFDTSVRLDWTAVGDDGTAGTATSQEARYLTGADCPIGASNFALGTQVAGVGPPAASGTPETVLAGGLQRQTAYCFAVRVTDEAGNASYSNSFGATTPDTAPPDAPFVVTANPTPRSIEVRFNSVGDDGSTGTATSYDLRSLSGAACPVTDANFATATQHPTGSPQPPGATEIVSVTGLAPSTAYCFAVKVRDDAGNDSALSNSAGGTTGADVTPPGPVANLAVGQQTVNSIQLTWTAVADDGSSAATGPAASYELRYLAGAACPINSGNFAGGTSVNGLSPPRAPGTGEAVTVTGLSAAESYCFLLRVVDGAGNATFSNMAAGSTVDNRPPAQVADLSAQPPAASGAVSLSWTAVGNHANVGTAASYDLRYQAVECASFDYATATPVAGLPSPQASGSAESFTVNGLSLFSRYCFQLRVINTDSMSSLSNVAASTPDPSAQIAAILDQIHSAGGSPVALNAAVTGAIVTYIKGGVAGSPPGDPDGPGFFVQNGDTGPALFFAMDPEVVLPGLAPSDVIDVAITQGAWLECPVSPCNADNSLYAITAATAIPRSTGVALPATQDLTNVALSLPIGPGPWAYEHERVSVTGGIGQLFPAAFGFKKARLTTTGTNSPNQQIRVTDQVVMERGVADGCQVTISDTPMWRFGGTAQFSAWSSSEIAVSACPPTLLLTVLPGDGASSVPATDPVLVGFNQPMTLASVAGQVTAGSCTGGIQLSANNFATCVPFTSSGAAANLNTEVTLTPAVPLTASGPYKVRVLGSASSPNGSSLGTTYTQPTGFTVAGGTCTSVAPVVISQIYGGGGNFGAPLTHDFVELHNRGSLPVSLSGWSLQYNSAAGTNSWITSPLQGTIAPGGYFLVQMSGGATGSPLPTPDWVGVPALSMSATTGRVALMSTTTPIPANTPCPGAGVVDFVGYGATPACSEGGLPLAVLSNTTAGFRGPLSGTDLACGDTDVNGTDFSTGAPAPRNSSATPNTCACQ